mgnify:FL=1
MSPDGEILAFPDGEGARRADRVDYHERSEDCLFSSNEVRFKGVTLAPKGEVLLPKSKCQFHFFCNFFLNPAFSLCPLNFGQHKKTDLSLGFFALFFS